MSMLNNVKIVGKTQQAVTATQATLAAEEKNGDLIETIRKVVKKELENLQQLLTVTS